MPEDEKFEVEDWQKYCDEHTTEEILRDTSLPAELRHRVIVGLVKDIFNETIFPWLSANDPEERDRWHVAVVITRTEGKPGNGRVCFRIMDTHPASLHHSLLELMLEYFAPRSDPPAELSSVEGEP